MHGGLVQRHIATKFSLIDELSHAQADRAHQASEVGQCRIWTRVPEGRVPGRFSGIRQTRWFCLHPTEVPVRKAGNPHNASAPSSPPNGQAVRL